MDIRSNIGIPPGQTVAPETRSAIETVANGVMQATPAGIAEAKDAFENSSMLGKLSSQTMYSGIAPAAHHLSPAGYLQEFKNTEMITESMRHISSLPQSGLGDPKMYDGISKKLTRERLDSLSNFPGPKFVDRELLGRLKNLCNTIQNMRDAHNSITQQAAGALK